MPPGPWGKRQAPAAPVPRPGAGAGAPAAPVNGQSSIILVPRRRLSVVGHQIFCASCGAPAPAPTSDGFELVCGGRRASAFCRSSEEAEGRRRHAALEIRKTRETSPSPSKQMAWDLGLTTRDYPRRLLLLLLQPPPSTGGAGAGSGGGGVVD
jgi:hypothetical protein